MKKLCIVELFHRISMKFVFIILKGMGTTNNKITKRQPMLTSVILRLTQDLRATKGGF